MDYEKKSSKYYVVRLRNNVNAYVSGSYYVERDNGVFEGIVRCQKEEKVIRKFLGFKYEDTEIVEYFDKFPIYAENKDGIMIDIITQESIYSNADTANLSYESVREVDARIVRNELKRLKDDDIARYKRAMIDVKRASLENYELRTRRKKFEEEDEKAAEDYIQRFRRNHGQ